MNSQVHIHTQQSALNNVGSLFISGSNMLLAVNRMTSFIYSNQDTHRHQCTGLCCNETLFTKTAQRQKVSTLVLQHGTADNCWGKKLPENWTTTEEIRPKNRVVNPSLHYFITWATGPSLTFLTRTNRFSCLLKWGWMRVSLTCHHNSLYERIPWVKRILMLELTGTY